MSQENTIEVNRLIRPLARLDVVLDMDLVTGRADIRSSRILDITPEFIIAAQTEPPVMKSSVNRTVEATVIHRNPITGDYTRWGWASRLLGLNNHFRLQSGGPQSDPVPVFFLTPPTTPRLARSNVRQFYRLDVGDRSRIEFRINPSRIPVTLLNFSAGGVLLGTPPPPVFELGQVFSYELIFPETPEYSRTVIRGRGQVVRQEHEPGQPMVHLGVKFLDQGRDTERDFQKIITAFMRQEQRLRNR